MDGGGIAPVSSPPSLGGELSSRASAAVAVACSVLILLYIFGRFACQYRKGRLPRNDGTTSSTARPSSCPPPRTACGCGSGDAERCEDGMTPLPVFVHMAGAEEKVSCAVCLVEFAHGEAGRLVPGCGHGFHAACIQTWIRVNSTCPLCRGAVVPPGADDRSAGAALRV